MPFFQWLPDSLSVHSRPLVVGISPFHGGNRGSNPLGDANSGNDGLTCFLPTLCGKLRNRCI